MQAKYGKRNKVGIPRRLIAAVLCLCTVLSAMSLFRFIPTAEAATGSATADVTRQADPSTMDKYKEMLDFSSNTRYAGRLWSDKTVFAYGYNNGDDDWNSETNVLTLKPADDGVSETIELDEDFLHVYSVLGSSQNINSENVRPLDVVLLLDISSSMTQAQGTLPIDQMLEAANKMVRVLMNNASEQAGGKQDPSIHTNNRVGIVVYGGGTQVLLPLGHYSAISSGAHKNEYFYVSSQVSRDNGNGYFPYMSTNVTGGVDTGNQRVTKPMVADATYLQGALYQGMDMLINADVDDTNPEQRVPVLIVLTDGATNAISATSTSNSRDSYDWWEPFIGIMPHAGGTLTTGQYANAGANPFYADCNSNTGNGSSTGRNSKENRDIEIQAIAPRTVSNLLLAGYMKKKLTQIIIMSQCRAILLASM